MKGGTGDTFIQDRNAGTGVVHADLMRRKFFQIGIKGRVFACAPDQQKSTWGEVWGVICGAGTIEHDNGRAAVIFLKQSSRSS